MFDADANDWQSLPVYERSTLARGQQVTGPALIVEDETTTHVPAGFRAGLSALGSLVLDDDQPRTTPPASLVLAEIAS